MNDDERRELAIHLRQMSRSLEFYSPDALRRVADEIERLVKELAEAKHHDMRDWYDALERGRRDPIR